MSNDAQTKRLADAICMLALTLTGIIQEQMNAIRSSEIKREESKTTEIKQNATQATLTKEDVAKFLGVTPRGLDNWMKRGFIPYYKIGRTVRFKLKDIEKHLDQNCRVQRRRSISRI